MIKRLGYSVLPVIMSCALGCAANKGEDSYIGWHCSGDERSDDWTCQQRRVKNGQLVDEPVNSVNTTSTVSPTESSNLEKVEQVFARISMQNWRQKLPSLTNAEVVSDTQGGGNRNRLASLPPRQPEPVTSVLAYPTGNDSDVHAISEIVPEKTEAASLVSQEISETGQTSALPRTGFTIQLGAFRTAGQLQQFIDDNHLESLSVIHFQTYGDNQAWHVVTWGDFETPAEAQKAWDQQAANHPKIEPWVRPLSSLQTLSLQQEGDETQES